MKNVPDYSLTQPTEIKTKPAPLTQSLFRWLHNEDPMATEKLADGISQFAKAQVELEKRFSELKL